MSRVLVTGGSGHLGGHVVLRLLADGHDVRTTVRTLDRRQQVREAIAAGGAEDVDRVSFVVADLLGDAGWAEAVADRDVVLHVASPFPAGEPDDEDDLIVPAREGTLRVLRAATDAGVSRVVLTSSFAAVGYTPKADPAEPYTEADWTDPTGDVGAYVRSKTLAERAAWEAVAGNPDGPELTVINPTGIFGPVLGPDRSSSIALVQALLAGVAPAPPTTFFGVVDVRDVADLHVRAMSTPSAAGERYLAVGEDGVSIGRIARILRAGLGPDAARVPWSDDDSGTSTAAPGPLPKRISNAKARTRLGWSPRPLEATILDTGRSLTQAD
ncbi:aldehyde reductase [Patulibacter sp.]|uniref:SDR family oxidoreductase n=1 Tax=Patulibacter sp. TaxID=1912859 RepID=UPI002721AD1F|nr:aldehyde reductase [Patulibacter sp.]MDO9408861.1 aldehyde reductase [Patulibacter sp.]